MKTIIGEDEMKNEIEIAGYNSIGIRVEARKAGITKMVEIGSGHSDGNKDNPNSLVIFLKMTNPKTGYEIRVADTNGDPVWEEVDISEFAELAEACGVKI